MADSFTTSNRGSLLVVWEVLVDGGLVPTKFQLDSLKTIKEVGKIPEAVLSYTNAAGRGDKEGADASAGDGLEFSVGADVKISLGTLKDGVKPVFEGMISDVGLQGNNDGSISIEVTCKDKANMMTSERKTVHHIEKTDSDAINAAIGNHPVSGEVKGTTFIHEDLTQYESSDWDFINARADFLGFVVNVSDNKVQVIEPVVSGPLGVYTYGIDISEANLSVNTADQVKEFVATAWDHQTQELVTATSSEPGVNGQGKTTGLQMAEKNGNPTSKIFSSVPIPADQLKVWADAKLLKVRLGRITGSISVHGNSDLKTNAVLTLAGLGDELNGDAYINKLEHSVRNNEWESVVHFGTSTKGFYQNESGNSVSTPSASGMLPGVDGIHIGKVIKIHTDPTKGFRVQVNVPTIGKPDDLLWARISQLQASNTTGFYVMPEVDDEVLVSFLNSDPRFPIILGSVYSKAIPMPVDPDASGDWDGKKDENNIKGFFSREGMKMQFQEVDKIIKIETPAGNIITMTEKDKKIIIEDENDNVMEMSPTGIDIYTPKDFTLKADMNIEMEAGMAFKTKSGTDWKAEAGTNLEAKAAIGATVKGATAELNGSGMCTVKGGIVQIN